jgi:hypothetical protein
VKRVVFTLAILFIVGSCAHQSGHYIEVLEGDSVASLAQEFGISEADLINNNIGKKIKTGQWIFVPMNIGILNLYDFVNEKITQFGDDPVNYGEAVDREFMWPVPASKRVSSPYGKRWGKFHHGIDIAAKSGRHILATKTGKVVYSGNGLKGYGNLTIISHGKKLFSVYAHARKNFTKKGQKVYKGQVIAQVGNTGRSTGPHLHFEIRKGKKTIDPLTFF